MTLFSFKLDREGQGVGFGSRKAKHIQFTPTRRMIVIRQANAQGRLVLGGAKGKN